MADKIEDGGPAFPTDASIQRGTGCDGMSIRDYFAGQALAGMMANPGRVGAEAKFTGWATQAYYFADAMLKARKGEL